MVWKGEGEGVKTVEVVTAVICGGGGAGSKIC